MKHRLILKSFADIPTDTLVPTVPTAGQLVTQVARATRRQIRAARRRSADLAREFYSRATAPLSLMRSWSRGGLNE